MLPSSPSIARKSTTHSTMQMQMEMRSMWQALRHNDDVRAIVLTGAGEEAFCSGIDRAEAIENDYLIDEERRRKHAELDWPRRRARSSTTTLGSTSTRRRTTCGSR